MSEKNFHTISEVSARTQLPQHTIRRWESKFKLLRPVRLKSGHRRYTDKDIELISYIKDLIFLKGYSLSGARKIIYGKNQWTNKPVLNFMETIHFLEEIKKEILEIIKEC